MLIFVMFFYTINNITGTKTYFLTCGAKSGEQCKETMVNKDLPPDTHHPRITLNKGRKAK
jgi:hypothetical protein